MKTALLIRDIENLLVGYVTAKSVDSVMTDNELSIVKAIACSTATQLQPLIEARRKKQ